MSLYSAFDRAHGVDSLSLAREGFGNGFVVVKTGWKKKKREDKAIFSALTFSLPSSLSMKLSVIGRCRDKEQLSGEYPDSGAP